MPRGHYGALNRETHFAAAWAEDAAVKRAIDQAAPVLGVAYDAKRGYDGTRKVISGAQMVRANRPTEGQEWFHSVKDRQLALDSISTALTTLATEIIRWHEEHPDQMQRAASVQWVETDVLPTMQEWNAFAARERASWWVRAATSWDTFVTWYDRVRSLRQLARAHGIVLETPELEPLPKTIWEKSDAGTGSRLAPWFGIAKLALGAAITVAGAVTVISVVRTWRAPRLPSHHAEHALPPAEPTAAPALEAAPPEPNPPSE